MNKEASLSQVALVTGGTTGIGLATVRALRGAGMNVGLFSSSTQKVEAALAVLGNEPGPEFYGATVDTSDTEAVAAFHADVERILGQVGTLICNAGVSSKRNGERIPLHETTRDEWETAMSVNLTGAFNCVRTSLPSMIRNQYGRIVLVGSIATRTTPKIAGAAYVASKSALSGLMRSLVGEYSRHGITCNLVAPGNVVTEMVAYLNQDQLAALAERVPVGRLGTPDDIAMVIDMLCRPSAGFVNGAIIDVNGGEFVAV